jgi:hypothetical protein
VLTTSQVANGLTTDQVAALTSNQVGALSTAQVSAFSVAAVAAIETADIGALKTAAVAALRTTQVAALTTDQVVALSTAQVAALSTAAISVSLSTDQIVALSSNQLNALSTNQLRALSTNSIAAIETADLNALSTTSFKALSTTQLVKLTTDQIVALTTGQIKNLTSQQGNALTSAQVEAMSTAQASALFNATHGISPIVLDLSGNGINTLASNAGVSFDLNADGSKEQAGWVAGGDGLLVLDRNGDGSINDGSELFGTGTTLANGSKASNGYEALAELDVNGDGVIDAKDAAFSKLQVWVDGNADGVSSADELKSLTDLGITKLSLTVKVDGSKDNGNTIGLTSTFETTDGATHVAADVWFAVSSNATTLTSSVSSLSGALSSFNAASAQTPQATKLEMPTANNAAVAALASAIGSYDSKLTAASNQAATEDSQRLKALLTGSHSQGILAAK